MDLSVAEVEGMARDRAALIVARSSAKADRWSDGGRSHRALWGRCAGADLYEVQVSLPDRACRCACEAPAPCRHALALLLLALREPELFPEGPEPEPVRAWLDRRGRARGGPGDPAAKARRASEREERVRQGVAALRAWLSDRAQVGLSELEAQPPEFWTHAAKRLEDHQIRGVPERIARLGERVRAGEDWAAEALAELGRLALLVEAAERMDALPAPLRAEVRSQLGFAQREAEVLARGTRTRDDWWVLGRCTETMRLDPALRAERTWLLGPETGAVALVLRYMHSSDRRPERPSKLEPGRVMRGEVAWYEGALPQRAALVEEQDLGPLTTPPPDRSISSALSAFAHDLAANPLLDRQALLVGPVRPTRARDRSFVVEESGQALPLVDGPHWWLHALSGGHPITLVGEWDGRRLMPLSVYADQTWHLPEP